MAKASIAGQPLECNEISLLARVFERSFEYHIDHNSSSFTEYLQSLRTLVGLGFTAALANGSLLSVYQTYLNQFLAKNEGDFKVNALNKTIIAQSTAQMVAIAVISFMILRHPRYYEDFLVVLEYTLIKTPLLFDQQRDVEGILKRLAVVF